MLNVVDTARSDGFAEGRKKGLAEKQKIARQMKQDGMPITIICKYTSLTAKEIENL